VPSRRWLRCHRSSQHSVPTWAGLFRCVDHGVVYQKGSRRLCEYKSLIICSFFCLRLSFAYVWKPVAFVTRKVFGCPPTFSVAFRTVLFLFADSARLKGDGSQRWYRSVLNNFSNGFHYSLSLLEPTSIVKRSCLLTRHDLEGMVPNGGTD
jgi:hypothetical protein